MVLKHRTDVSQQNDWRFCVTFRKSGRKILKHVEFDAQGLALVHIPFILARPPERAPFDDLQALNIDPARLEQLDMLFWKIIAHNPNEVNRRQQARSNRCIRRRATKQFMVLFQFCFDAINGNGTYDQDGHKLFDETQIRLAQTESLKSKRIAILGIILCASGAAASTVDDLKDLDFLVSTVRENYAGFDDKVTPDLEPQLATLTGQMREKAG